MSEWGTCDLGDSDFNDAEGDITDALLSNGDHSAPTELHIASVHSSHNEAPLPQHNVCGAAMTDLLNSLS